MMKLLSLLMIMITLKQQCCQEDAINVMVVQRISAEEGDIANLFCNYTAVNSVGNVDITWYTRVLYSYYVIIASASGNPPVVLESSSLIERERYVITDMATLEIDNVSRFDAGQYKCEVLDSSNSSIGDYGTVNLTVTYLDLPVSFEISPSEVEIGLSTKLTCEVTSYPRANVSFWKGSEKLQVDSERYYEVYNGMWITNVHIDDDGEYTCLTDNGIEQHYSEPITLTVQFAPIVYPLKPIEVYANEPHKVRFTFDAEPQGSCTWLDNNGDVIEGETNPYLEVNFDKSDIGLRTNFTFILTNYLGSDQQTVTVIVTLQTAPLTSGEVAVIVVCSCFATAVLVFLVMYLKSKYARREASKNLKRPSRQEILGTSILSRASIGLPTDSWEIVRNKLVLKEVIGEGFFGKVIRAEFYLKGKKGKNPVAIKTLKDDCKTAEKFRLQDELELMKTFDKHPNIIDLIGCCTIDDPIYIVLEFAPFGNLRDYLFKSRKSKATTLPVLQESEDAAYETVNFEHDAALSPPNADDLTSFAWQITRAMSYLASIKCVHRDLAARNVLLTYDKRCKLSDFGMAYTNNEGGLYEDLNQPKLPIRWMAPEAILDNIYTTNSDVWSFGVTLWEIITLGGYPYPGVTTDELIEKIKEGYRMPKPDHCEDPIYEIMKCCWQLNADDRPSFDQLTTRLDNILSAEKDYIDFTFFRGSIYENVQCELLMTDQQTGGDVIERAENIAQKHHNKQESHHIDECCHHEEESKYHKYVKIHHENGDDNRPINHSDRNSHKDENNYHKDVYSYHEGENKNQVQEQENIKHYNHGQEKIKFDDGISVYENKNNQHAYDNINYQQEDKNSQFGEGEDHQRDTISDLDYDNRNNVENTKTSNHMYDNNITDERRNSDSVYETSTAENHH